MGNLEELRFTKEHEWLQVVDGTATVGITDHAQEALGDIVYVELPEVGEVFDQGDIFGVIESVKTASDLYAPVSGTVLEVNETLADDAAIVNEDCYGDGWMIKLEIKLPEQLDSLMTPEQYEKHVAEEESK